jgi:hypothetical protein
VRQQRRKKRRTAEESAAELSARGDNNSIWNSGNDATQLVRRTDFALGIDELLLTSVFSKLPIPKLKDRYGGDKKCCKRMDRERKLRPRIRHGSEPGTLLAHFEISQTGMKK